MFGSGSNPAISILSSVHSRYRGLGGRKLAGSEATSNYDGPSSVSSSSITATRGFLDHGCFAEQKSETIPGRT
jgi:hypothetical protein